MGCRQFLSLCVSVACLYFAFIGAKGQDRTPPIPRTRFTCVGRTSGYYADVETGCQIHLDFDALYIDGANSFHLKWNDFIKMIQEIKNTNCKDDTKALSEYINRLTDDDDKLPFQIKLLCQLVSPKDRLNRRQKISIAECTESFIVGVKVYHMCDGLGRQFSYTCPNTTLFQQRMLICDHWYMVNCSKSESDYDANLLIGQRDKPFVSEADMQLRTPRPDILSVPPNGNYYDGLREAETKFPLHPGNSIVGFPDTISTNNGLDSAKVNYRPPTSWSTGTGGRPSSTRRPNQTPNVQTNLSEEEDTLTGAASQRPSPTFRPTPTEKFTHNTGGTGFPITTPSQDLSPPITPTTEAASSEEFELDIRMKDKVDPVINFIKRFDPNSPDSHKTSMTKTEILNLNQQLPDGQVSSEEDRTPRKNKDNGNSANRIADQAKGVTESSRFDSVNIKPTEVASTFDPLLPSRELLPPKSESTDPPSTTIGPPIYYEWKWAVPAFDLEPPKLGNITNATTVAPQGRNAGRSPFSSVTRPTPEEVAVTASNTEYNISSYFIPDYVFPLDKPHPGYEDDNAETSFNVKVSRPGRASYGENPACPQCHPAYLIPGTCEPCVVER